MNAVAVAMAEIVREGTWALRALGYPYGTAERAAGLLAWTEAVNGHGLTMLRLGEAAILAGAAQPPPRWSRDAQGRRYADAHGKCLFECGPPALDLATSDARLGDARLGDARLGDARLGDASLGDASLGDASLGDASLGDARLADAGLADACVANAHTAAARPDDAGRAGGIGRAILRGAIGTRLSGALGAIAARRGLAAVLVHAPGTAEIAPVPAAGWIFALPTPEGPAFQVGSLDQALPAILPAPLQAAAEDIAAAATAGAEGFFSITLLPCPAMPPPADATDWPQRLALAYRAGTQADPADLQTLYSLEMRTWAPTSERSRNQAGFGRF